MSEMIRFMEAMGSDASFAFNAQAYDEALTALDVEEDQRHALARHDLEALGVLLNARQKMICAVFAPDEQPNREGEEKPDDVPEQEENPRSPD